ncbi:MAG TPA: YbaK/EbsC family protein [Nitrospiria bacterium]|jgi:Ala-tRNA(Pro) deacylase|nr:YbaK/EbsC family protein [Nitrospiria bacterium]
MLPFEMKSAMKLREWWRGYKGIGKKRERSGWPTAPERLKMLFETEKVPYRVIPHAEVYTAPELAASIHTSGRKVAKAVMVLADGRYVMAVLPAHRQLDLDRFSEVIGAAQVSLATEAVLEKLFPDCELGAIPPFGTLYEFRVFVDESLALEPEIFFQSGTHHEMIAMRYSDFERLVHPLRDRFAMDPAKRAGGF